MFADPESKVAGVREVFLPQLVFFHLQATFENFFSFRAPDGDMHGNLLISSDTEGTDCVAGFAYGENIMSVLTDGNIGNDFCRPLILYTGV